MIKTLLFLLMYDVCFGFEGKQITISVEHVETFGFKKLEKPNQKVIPIPEKHERYLRDLMNAYKSRDTTTWLPSTSDNILEDLATDEASDDIDDSDRNTSYDFKSDHWDYLDDYEDILRDELEMQLSALAPSTQGNAMPGSKGHRSRRAVLETISEEEWVEEVTDSDHAAASQAPTQAMLLRIGLALAGVVIFAVLAYCVAQDPMSFLYSLGMGIPCCFLCVGCCTRCFHNYLDPREIIKSQINKYMPGIIVNEDGTLEEYDISEEESDLMMQIFAAVKEVMDKQ